MNVTPVNNYLVPATGTTNSVPVVGNFTASPTRVDFREVELNGVQFVPSGVFIDNSAGVGPLTIAIESMSGFSVVCQPGQRIARQYPAPIDQIVNITGNGAGIVIFVDFPVIPSTDTVAGSASAVTIANGADVAEGNTGDAAVTNPANPGTVIGLLKGIITRLFGVGAEAQNVQGNSASGAADVGNPVKIGGVANNTPPAITANGNRIDNWVNGSGAQVVAVATFTSNDAMLDNPSAFPTLTNNTARPMMCFQGVFNGATWTRMRGDLSGTYVQSEFRSDWSYAAVAGGIVNTTAVAIKGAAGAGVVNFLTSITIHNTAAVASEFLILNGVTVIWRGNVPASMTAPQVITFPRPLRSSANAALNVQLSTTATATFVNAQGFAQ